MGFNHYILEFSFFAFNSAVYFGSSYLVGEVSKGYFGVVVVGLQHPHLDDGVCALLRLPSIFGIDLNEKSENTDHF